MENSGGWISLPSQLLTIIHKLNLQWWRGYEDSKTFNAYQALMFVDLDTLKRIQTQEEADSLRNSLLDESCELVNTELINESYPFTENEKKEIISSITEYLDNATEEERIEYWKSVGFYWQGFIMTFFDHLAVMIHGKSMRSLVKEAKLGDDKSFVLAVQIDRSVLKIAYFQDRIQKAQFTQDSNFLDSLGYRIKNPIISGKIKRRTLYLLFSILENEQKLDMPIKELLALCEFVGVYGDEHGVRDENSLSKRRSEFRKKHGTRKIF